MSELGTGYIVQINIDSYRNTPMRDLNFSLEFYVQPNRRIYFSKQELVCIEKEEENLYFALIDSRLLNQGDLWCNVKIVDPEPQWISANARPVVIKRYTGINIGTPTSSTSASRAVMKEWDQGYKIDFNIVWGLPKADVAYIFYGKFIDQIQSFDDLTPDMLLSPDNHIISVSAGKMGKTPISNLSAGNKVLVLIPSDYDLVATKDNGIGGKVPFDTTIMGCNGEKSITVDSTPYKIYGEFMTVSGELFIYVD